MEQPALLLENGDRPQFLGTAMADLTPRLMPFPDEGGVVRLGIARAAWTNGAARLRDLGRGDDMAVEQRAEVELETRPPSTSRAAPGSMTPTTASLFGSDASKISKNHVKSVIWQVISGRCVQLKTSDLEKAPLAWPARITSDHVPIDRLTRAPHREGVRGRTLYLGKRWENGDGAGQRGVWEDRLIGRPM